ncbi:peptidyl-prolyl cis-trans isomerase CYP59 [Magnolia sinica]|uniref:peptidyl-prolyl cis-trans isomerase CYP59 n=1 Tax=Magnolia sinica TaxID=86752 RepID=UPI002657BA94|nr:peptidyl-prolyl cis-trans isomerase CYP59 [Magnolia sinica]
MSVLIVTSLGDIVIDLHTDRCPLTTKNFLKLCKIKYFNGCLFHTVQKDFTAQTGDPTGKGTGGDSVYKFLYGDQARFFGDEIHPDLKHSKTGTVAMASAGENLNASQFYFTLRDDLDYLDGKHTVFGEVAEGIDTLMRINEAYVDDKGRPYKNIRIKHTYILDDPFEDPPQLTELIPERSPEGKPLDEMEEVRLEDDWVPMDETLGPAELEEALRLKEAQSNAVFLETVGDIPDAEIKPPENVLFVCKLNPITQDEDLDTIFSRFGTVLSAEVIRDYKTGDSLCYAFIEFETNEACEQAYFKMDNALIDDRRIHVDFSQSVAKLWSQYRRGKGNQNGKGRGCFKCGGLDHIAKDCAESPTTKKQNPKYTLKDENTQRGGDARQSYDMVFDGDTLPSLDREDKKHREHKTEDETKRWKRGNDQSSGDFRSKRDSTNDRDREGHDHSNSGRRGERGQGTRGSSRDDEHQGGRYSRERMSERRRDEENRKKRHDDDHPRRAKQDDRKRSNDHDVDPPRREDRNDKKTRKYSNDNNHGQGKQDDEKSRDQDGDRDSRQRRHVNSDIDRHRRDERYENKRSIGHSGNPHKREGGDRKRETEHHSSADRRDGQDDRKNYRP